MLGKLMNTYHINTARMSLALNRSSAPERFERGNAIEIRNGIMFDFYPGLPHIQIDIGSAQKLRLTTLMQVLAGNQLHVPELV